VRPAIAAALAVLVCSALIQCAVSTAPAFPDSESDLDVLMRQVLAGRDANWKKLQQFVLDETERLEIRGSSQRPIWGERREYNWYIRDGLFVRSPVSVNGAPISESERRRLEAEFVNQEKNRADGRGNADAGLLAGVTSSGLTVTPPASGEPTADGLVNQMREPRFVSMAYFLRFKFERGQYAFVGREPIDGRDLLRIEYYPTQLFTGTDRQRGTRRGDSAAYDAEFQRLMNKVALVTLWIDPESHQIVRYTFDNVALDFLPAQWLVHVDSAKASMTMAQPFPGVWLPREVGIDAAMSLVSGQLYLHYGTEYHDYRKADVKSNLTVP